MGQYIVVLKVINVFVIIVELFLVIIALMNMNLFFIEAVFKVALLIVYLQIINHVILDEHVKVLRVLLSITSMIILFYTIVFLGGELLFALIILAAYLMLVVLSTPRNKLLPPNVIALITPIFLVPLLKMKRMDVLYAFFLVATIMVLQTTLTSTKFYSSILRIFDDKVAKPILDRLKESKVGDYIKPLLLKHIKFSCTKITNLITKINNEARNLELKLYSAIRILEDILQIAVRTEAKLEEYISEAARLVTKLEFIVEHHFVLMLILVTIMLLITIIFYLISPLI
ncbi:MAG: hypothetical protein QXJ97_06975 [Desulfurococcaceae archaeon]